MRVISISGKDTVGEMIKEIVKFAPNDVFTSITGIDYERSPNKELVRPAFIRFAEGVKTCGRQGCAVG